jgi:hypothetical protein
MPEVSAWPLDLWLGLGALLAVIALLGFVGRKRLHDLLWTRRLRRALARLGRPVVRDLKVPDGLGGLWRFDYALPRADGGVLLVSLRHYPGLIYAGEGLDEWTQMLAGRSYRFSNPLHELARQRSSVALLLGSSKPVEIVLVFGPEARFPRDRPAAVASVEDLEARAGEGPARGEGATWEALLSLRV